MKRAKQNRRRLGPWGKWDSSLRRGIAELHATREWLATNFYQPAYEAFIAKARAAGVLAEHANPRVVIWKDGERIATVEPCATRDEYERRLLLYGSASLYINKGEH